MSGIRKPSFSRMRNASFSTQDSVTSHEYINYSSDDEITEPTETPKEQPEKILGSARRKLTLVSLCLVYFSATACFSVISPFFPDEVRCSYFW